MIFTALGLDPGGTTGWATYQAKVIEVPVVSATGFVYEWYDEKFTCGLLEGPEHHDQLYTLLELSHTGEYHIVCESFEYRNKSRAGLELISKEYIGVVALFAIQRNMAKNVHWQTASMGKISKSSFIKKSNLQTMGLWSSSHENRHAMDAYGHLLYWLVTGPYKRYDLLKRMGK